MPNAQSHKCAAAEVTFAAHVAAVRNSADLSHRSARRLKLKRSGGRLAERSCPRPNLLLREFSEVLAGPVNSRAVLVGQLRLAQRIRHDETLVARADCRGHTYSRVDTPARDYLIGRPAGHYKGRLIPLELLLAEHEAF
jgi:hypothetical protein